MIRSLLLSAALVACIGSAAAQQVQPAKAPAAPAQPALTPEQQAALARQDQQMTQAAERIMQMVDGNRIGEVWDSASVAMKGLVSRAEFVKQVAADRAKVGKVATRGKATVSRSQFAAGEKVPQGLYLNVAVPTKFANMQQPVRELVSFRLDQDKVWRVSGYSLR